MSDDKRLSGEEKRRLMKEQFKQDLRERKVFLDKVEQLRRQGKILKAMEGMKLEDDSEEWIRRLDEETSFREAKVEMALESAIHEAVEGEKTADMEKLLAEEMVRQLKLDMGKIVAEEKTAITPSEKPLVDLESQAPPPADSNPGDKPERKMLDGVE